jgi:hypothetical protein
MSQELIKNLKSFLSEYPTPTLESIFENTPEGEFSQNITEQGDWYLQYDSDSRSWNKTSFVVSIGRVNGFRWIEVESRCLDDKLPYYMTDLYLSEQDDTDEFTSFHKYSKLFHSKEDYFIGWAEYWLYCATEGTDQLGECFPTDYQSKIQNGTWVEFCINSAKANIKSLEGGQKFLDSL